jgi:diguanylate cyclase (GGDEF)-like protein/PAS domain S-box-containing protein
MTEPIDAKKAWSPHLNLLSTVRGRIIAVLGLMLVIFGGVIAGSAWLQDQHRSARRDVELHAATANQLADARFRITLSNLLLERFLATGNENIPPVVRSSLIEAEEMLIGASATETEQGNEEELARLDEVGAGIAVLAAAAEDVIALQESGDAIGARAAIEAAALQIRDLGTQLTDAVDFERSELPPLESEADRTGDLALVLLVVSGAASVGLVLAMVIVVIQSILKPLSSLETTANKLARGDLETRAAITGPGELRSLAHSLNEMTEGLLHRESELRRSEGRFRQLVSQAADGIFVADLSGRFIEVNDAACEMLGYTPEELLTMSVADISENSDPATVPELHERVMSGETITLEASRRRKDGTILPTEVRIGTFEAEGRRLMLAIARDTTDRKRAEGELRDLNAELERDRRHIEALNRSLEEKVERRTRDLAKRNRELLSARARAATDGLSGLRNHRAFHERIRSEVARAQKRGTPLGVIMLDVDGFKQFNDTHGHLAGDRVLRDVANILADGVSRDNAFRYGGDEFATVLINADRQKAVETADRLRRAVETGKHHSGERITVSLGVATFPDIATTAEKLVYKADMAMYWAKSAGKNQVGDWDKMLTRKDEEAVPWYLADRDVKAPVTVAALIAALDARDPITRSHTERCSWYTAKLAEAMGLDEHESSTVRLASLLHDIGKLAIRDSVLRKKGPLTKREWALMKEHPTAALQILSHIPEIAHAVPAILHHHEHFNGGGYPDGLAREEIPLPSRILLVTDAFDAMTTDRPYRRAMSIEAAIEELKINSGSQFDPQVVEAFLGVLERHGPHPSCRAPREEKPVAVSSGGNGRRA